MKVLKDFWPDLYRIYWLGFAKREMEENLGQLLKCGLLKKNTSDALKALFMYLLPFADNLSLDKVASSKSVENTPVYLRRTIARPDLAAVQWQIS